MCHSKYAAFYTATAQYCRCIKYVKTKKSPKCYRNMSYVPWSFKNLSRIRNIFTHFHTSSNLLYTLAHDVTGLCKENHLLCINAGITKYRAT